MTNLNYLSLRFIEQHPDDAARDVERIEAEQIIAVFQALPVETTAKMLVYLAPLLSTKILTGVEMDRAISILDKLPANNAATMIRRLPSPLRSNLIKTAEAQNCLRSACRLVAFPAGTVGTIMDPETLVLQKSMTMDDVNNMLKTYADALPGVFYVVDESGRLCGHVTARDLLLKDATAKLSDFVLPCTHTIPSRAYLDSVIDEAGWNTSRCLPVIDRDGLLLGVLDRDYLLDALANLDKSGAASTQSRDILLGLAETFLQSVGELMSGNSKKRYH